MPIGRKITKIQKNVVKLPYSAQKVLLKALNLVIFFVLIFPLKAWWYGLGCKCVTALLRLISRGKTKGFRNFFILTP